MFYFKVRLAPQVKVASIFIDQPKPNDIGHRLAARHSVPIFGTVVEALCLGGTNLAVDGAIDKGLVSKDLIEAAWTNSRCKMDIPLKDLDHNPILVRILYRDGTRAALLMTDCRGEYWGYAARLKRKIVACEFVHAPPPTQAAYFSYIGLNAQRLFLTGKPPWAVERTLLTSGILDTAIRSMTAGGTVIKTPFLDIRYAAPSEEPIRPKGEKPAGASLLLWPPAGYDEPLPAKP